MRVSSDSYLLWDVRFISVTELLKHALSIPQIVIIIVHFCDVQPWDVTLPVEFHSWCNIHLMKNVAATPKRLISAIKVKLKAFAFKTEIKCKSIIKHFEMKLFIWNCWRNANSILTNADVLYHYFLKHRSLEKLVKCMFFGVQLFSFSRRVQ